VLQEVVAAVKSLYKDEMKPFGRLLRKRLVERITPCGAGASDKTADIDMQHLHAVVQESDEFVVIPEEGCDWSVTLVSTPSNFVDVYSPDDAYPAELWAQAGTYFMSAHDEEMTLPGGRYSCAQALQSRRLPFFEGRSLGQLCHIVELAICDKKMLGYLNGAIVTYGRSQSMLKERSAGQHQAIGNPCIEAASLPCATLEEAKVCLRKILAEAASRQAQGPGQVALSNVKRMFRSQFELELSETTLGHAKLTDLLQDACFADVCDVHLEKNGYQVVQKDQSNHDFSGFCSDEPLCLSDAEQSDETVAFGPTPGPFGPTPLRANFISESVQPLRVEDVGTLCVGSAPGLFCPAPVLPSQPIFDDPTMHEGGSYLKQLLHEYLDQPQNVIHEAEMGPPEFCLDEPLCLDAADSSSHVLGFGPTPGPFGWSPSPHYAKPLKVTPLPSLSPWKDGQLDSMVQRTFIHAQSPVKTPKLGGIRRSSSMCDLSESTSARSASGDSVDVEANHNCADSPSDEGHRQGLVVTDNKESFPPTPMFWAPATPFTPPGLDVVAPQLPPLYSMFPVLRLSELLVEHGQRNEKQQPSPNLIW
jgi:hypothetical protein